MFLGLITCSLKGQLGNQLFEIAAALCLAFDHHDQAVFPSLETSHRFGVPTNYEKIFFRLDTETPEGHRWHKFRQRNHPQYLPIPYNPNMKIIGYFQSEKFFKHQWETIRPYFAPSDEIMEYLQAHFSDIIDDEKTVAIHIRTYNKKKDDPYHKTFFFNGLDYVLRAMEQFPADSHFVVFSDDIPWAKNELKDVPKNIRFIENQTYYHDFYLMSLCRHQIISNSTFSWWAAYLNDNPDKVVVAPSRWFANKTDYGDIIPEDWVIVSSE